MDDRLKKALEQANFNVTVQTQKKTYRLAFNNGLIYAQDGGTFVADPSLISFVASLVQSGMDSAVIVDSRENPIMIDNLGAFRDKLQDIYVEKANEFYVNMQALRKSRNPTAVVKA